MSIRTFFFAATTAAALMLANATASAAPQVVVSIKPVHSLVAAVMAGVKEPELIISSGASPHGYRLKPSAARSLSQAKLVFWVGPELETFLEKPIRRLAREATSVALLRAPGIKTLKVRNEHDADHHGSHADHGHHTGIDPHIWLDPVNASLMVDAISTALITADPANATQYEKNAGEISSDLKRFTKESMAQLSTVKDRPFFVFHDSYQYFEKRFGLQSLGAIVGNPDVPASARHVSELRNKLRAQSKPTCVFSEPQFSDQLARTVASAGDAPVASLDPIGADIPAGPQHYLSTMTALRNSLTTCLTPVR